MTTADSFAPQRREVDVLNVLLQWEIPFIREHRGLSWDDLLDEAAARYETAKRLRQQEAA